MSARGMNVLDWKGHEVDYVKGWCMAIPRKAYLELGLFDSENLQFAYCEDADFCLRAREKDWNIYALNATFIHHHGNVTTKEVGEKRDMRIEFLTNHAYLEKRHIDYLTHKRVLVNYPEVDVQVSKDETSPEEVVKKFDKW